MACESPKVNLQKQEAVTTQLSACPACVAKRVHTDEEWKLHPMRGHGCYDGRWTHPALTAEAAAKAGIKK
jgi:hypothetical protein